MEVKKNDEINIEDWNLLLLYSKYSSPFQTRIFYEIINTINGFLAEVFAVIRDNEIKALCVITLQKEHGIKGFLSKRAIVYGGPLLLDGCNVELTLLLHSIYNYYKSRAIYIEIRNYFSYTQFDIDYKKASWHWVPYFNVEINLEYKTIDDVLSSMKYNRRREIRLTLNEGTIFRETNDPCEIESLFLILKDLYKKRVKLPLPDIQFFQNLFNSPIGKTFIVIHNNKIIGGCFCLFFHERTIFTMYYCGLRNYDKKIFPTHLSILAAIDFGINNKLKSLDLMGAGKINEEYGVRNYKQEFGGELKEIGRFVKVNNSLLYYIGKLGIKLMKTFF